MKQNEAEISDWGLTKQLRYLLENPYLDQALKEEIHRLMVTILQDAAWEK
jgi:hypothetical protein